MTRSELVARLAQRFPQLTAQDAEFAVRLMLDAIGDALAEGLRVEVRGFGSFSLSFRPSRIGRNPKSGVSVFVPERYIPHFKAGKELRERVDASYRARATCSGEAEAGASASARGSDRL
ncbi:MAG: integration host factor subunit beta [Casimicrobiaceae bacterium]|nr:integration host factor subunit beta [Casimicrobiaceae bacterium]MCX8098010.1 integration host factor subunit beta [Casimicrobiaceae bacterium]MDW8311696.1 integration host factor subunit beta [Burkholderiales bacterium]